MMLELEKLREKIARLEGGISKGEMLYFKVIAARGLIVACGYSYENILHHLHMHTGK